MSPQQYDPEKHNRRSIRLKGWDYRTLGFYFITICAHRRQHLFVNEALCELVMQGWHNIPTHPHAQHIGVDQSILMSNHFHGVLQVKYWVAGVEETAVLPHGLIPNSVPAIVGNFKSVVARRINNVRRTHGEPVWQRGYYERIVRNERELNAIREYIRLNPLRWAEDRDNLDALINKITLID